MKKQHPRLLFPSPALLLLLLMLRFALRWLRPEELIEIRLHHAVVDLTVAVCLSSHISLDLLIRGDDKC